MEEKKNKSRDIHKKYKSFVQSVGIRNIIIIGACGAALILLSVYPLENEDNNNSGKRSYTYTGKNNDEADMSYETYLEKKLKDTLERIPDIGEVSVMITTDSSGNDNKREIKGVLIITGKDASGKTISQISDAAMALFSIDAHKIKVIRGK